MYRVCFIPKFKTKNYINHSYNKSYSSYGSNDTPIAGRFGNMGGATKPLIVLIGCIEKDFDVEEVAGIDVLLEKLKESIGNAKIEIRVKQKDESSNEITNFIDPSRIAPSKASKFCSLLDLSKEVSILLKSYKKPNKHFMYSIEAMLRLLFYQRLSRIKYYTTLEAKLKDDGIARDLGFKKDGKEFLTPAERTINLFVNERLGNENLRAVQKSFIERLQRGLAEKGIKLGRRISVDSTPLPTLKNDECGKYNAYHFQKYNIGKMVKDHFACDVDTNIPLELIVTDANAYDGHYLIPMLEKLRELGIEPEEIYGDTHYGTIDNWAMCSMLFNCKCYFQIPENAKFNKKGTEKWIEKVYNGIAYEKGLDYDVSFEEKLRILFEHSYYEEVGAYFRNQWLKIKQENPEEYERIYHRRNVSENLHSILKEQLLFDKNLNVKGFKAIEFYARQFLGYIALRCSDKSRTWSF